MADSKITALAALTAADPVNDMFPVVDVSDTSMAASGTTKRISANNILSSSPTASGALTVTGLVTAGSASITGAATVGTTLGVTGVSTLASATITGAATVGTTLAVTGNLTAAADSILGTGSKAADTLLDFKADTGTQRIYLDRGGRNLIFKDVTTNIENYRITGVTGVHTWGVGGSTAMTLDASGNLLLGTTSLLGTERLNVTKTTVASYLARFINTNTTVDTFGITVKYSASAPNDASHNFLYVEDSVNVRAQIYANGGLANYSANNVNLSDARTKTDIKPLTSYWNKIKALELVTFKYKDQTHDDDNIGLISQQVESVAPEFVSNEGFGETPADGVPLKSIYTTDLYHAAIKALQEAMTRIEVLESKLA